MSRRFPLVPSRPQSGGLRQTLIMPPAVAAAAPAAEPAEPPPDPVTTWHNVLDLEGSVGLYNATSEAPDTFNISDDGEAFTVYDGGSQGRYFRFSVAAPDGKTFTGRYRAVLLQSGFDTYETFFFGQSTVSPPLPRGVYARTTTVADPLDNGSVDLVYSDSGGGGPGVMVFIVEVECTG